MSGYSKLILVATMVFVLVLSAGCASVCVPVHVQESYPQYNLNSCMIVIENHSFPMAKSDCNNIKNNAINWLSFENFASRWKGVDHVCEMPKGV